MRVQIPAYTDAWMKGDRYGEVKKTSKRPIAMHHTANAFRLADVHHVKLDKSGKTVRVWADDCQEV